MNHHLQLPFTSDFPGTPESCLGLDEHFLDKFSSSYFNETHLIKSGLSSRFKAFNCKVVSAHCVKANLSDVLQKKAPEHSWEFLFSKFSGLQ